MRVLLAIPDLKENGTYHFPIGIAYVSSYLKAKGYDITAFNANHYPPERLKEVLAQGDFGLVATGGLFVHTAVIKAFVDRVREHSPGSKLVLGGALAAGDPEFVLDVFKADGLVLGEGEVSMAALIKAMIEGRGMEEVPGVAFRKDGKLICTPAAPLIEPLDQLPLPDYEGFEFGHYLDHHAISERKFLVVGKERARRTGYVVSSRDCACKCTFCFRMFGGKFRLRSLDNLMQEIRYLRDTYQINELNVMDEMFAADKKRVMEFCRLIKPLDMAWVCQLRVNVVDDEMLRQMKEAGCHLIGYGFESGSLDVLKSMRKGITPRQIDAAIQATFNAKITIQGNFIFGDPAEDLRTLDETIRFTRKFSKLFIGYGHIIPYPGTVLYHDLVRKGAITDRWEFFLNPGGRVYNMTGLSDVDFSYLRRKVFIEKLLRYDHACGKIRTFRKIGPGVYDLSIRCQHCRTVNHFGAYDRGTHKGKYFICKECCQRILLNEADPRLLNFPYIRHRWVGLYVWRLICSTPGIHRVIAPVLLGIKAAMTRLKILTGRGHGGLA